MEIKIMAFSLNKYDIPAEIKKEIMEMYSNESDAMESQIKDLSKKMKSFSDYEDLKTKSANFEAEIEKIKNESKEQLLNTKKQYAYDNAIKSSNVSSKVPSRSNTTVSFLFMFCIPYPLNISFYMFASNNNSIR